MSRLALAAAEPVRLRVSGHQTTVARRGVDVEFAAIPLVVADPTT
jgi:hypothetical protein